MSFATNQTTLKGVDPDGSQRAWDLYVKTRYIDATRNPGRALIAASGTPITNSLAELFTLQRFIQPDALQERGIQEFDAWAANFGETRTELELQPSGLYKPVTRFCEFVNVPDLMAIYSHVDGRRAEVRPAPVSPPARDRGRPTPDHRGPGERSLPRLSAPSRRAHQGDRGAAEEAAEGRRHPALGHHRRPPRRDRPPLRPLDLRRTSRRTSSTP